MKLGGAKILLLAIGVTLVAACASGPTYRESAAKTPPIEAGKGRIFIYRKTTFGTAIQPEVKINDRTVGKAKPRGYFYVDLPPGEYEISASTEAERSLGLTLDAGEERYVRLEMKMGAFVAHVKPLLVDTAEGQEQIQEMKYTGGEE
jgi:hypothetical protein